MVREGFRHKKYTDEDLLSQINDGFISILNGIKHVTEPKLRTDYRLDTISSVCDIFKSSFAKYKLRVLTLSMFREIFFGGCETSDLCSIYDMERNAISNLKNEMISQKAASNFVKKSNFNSQFSSFIAIGNKSEIRPSQSNKPIDYLSNSRFDNSPYFTSKPAHPAYPTQDHPHSTYPQRLALTSGPIQDQGYPSMLSPNPREASDLYFSNQRFQVEQVSGRLGDKRELSVLENCVLKKELVVTPAEIEKFKKMPPRFLQVDEMLPSYGKPGVCFKLLNYTKIKDTHLGLVLRRQSSPIKR